MDFISDAPDGDKVLAKTIGVMRRRRLGHEAKEAFNWGYDAAKGYVAAGELCQKFVSILMTYAKAKQHELRNFPSVILFNALLIDTILPNNQVIDGSKPRSNRELLTPKEKLRHDLGSRQSWTVGFSTFLLEVVYFKLTLRKE
ncbi:hypothetical protein L1987_04326 [Smallanthus sonchifolius]|uniref:Uncharacterized protein n=1 Tax=Smallanthus sonchifolius TaxID=185202 RepID=A0ACB9KD56_9ASTR|nr:hypothetical protein L1987_04326 [Smallanthus sonchifolius]